MSKTAGGTIDPFAGFRHIARNLRGERIHVLELLFGPEIARIALRPLRHRCLCSGRTIGAPQPFRFPRAHRRAVTKVRHPTIQGAREPRLCHVDSVGGKCSLARSGSPSETQLASQFFSCFHGAENGVFASEHLRALIMAPAATARRIAVRHDLAVHLTAGTPTTSKLEAAPSFSAEADCRASLAEYHSCPTQFSRSGRELINQLPHEVLGLSRRKLPMNCRIKRCATPRSRMSAILCCVAVSKAARHWGATLWPDAGRTNDPRCATCVFVRGARKWNDRLMTEMHAVKAPIERKSGPGSWLVEIERRIRMCSR